MKTLLLGALLVAAAPVSAQHTSTAGALADASTARTSTTSERLVALRGHTDSPVEPLIRTVARRLQASSADERAEGLQQAVYYASNFSDLLDFTPIIPALLSIVERDPDPTHRVMASQALCRIGDQASIEEMARLARNDRDRQARRLILRGAAAHLSTNA